MPGSSRYVVFLQGVFSLAVLYSLIYFKTGVYHYVVCFVEFCGFVLRPFSNYITLQSSDLPTFYEIVTVGEFQSSSFWQKPRKIVMLGKYSDILPAGDTESAYFFPF